MSEQEQFRTRDLRLAALALALGGKLIRADSESADGHLGFIFIGVTPDLPLRVANREVTVDAGVFIGALEQVQVLIHQHRRAKR